MLEEYEKQKRKRLALRRSLMDYSIGVLIVLPGFFFLFVTNLKLDINKNYPPERDGQNFRCYLPLIWRLANLPGL